MPLTRPSDDAPAIEWAAYLRKGDGQGVVPMAVAQSLYDANMIRGVPPSERSKIARTHCFVRLKGGTRGE